MRKEYTFHSKEEKLKIVKRYLSGESSKALGKELGISDGNIRKWKRQYLSGGETALVNQKNREPIVQIRAAQGVDPRRAIGVPCRTIKAGANEKRSRGSAVKKTIEPEGGDIRRK